MLVQRVQPRFTTRTEGTTPLHNADAHAVAAPIQRNGRRVPEIRMNSPQILGAAEGTSAEIAWIVIYVLCVILAIAPFALWWAGVRTPRSEKRLREAAPRPEALADTDTQGNDVAPREPAAVADVTERSGGGAARPGVPSPSPVRHADD